MQTATGRDLKRKIKQFQETCGNECHKLILLVAPNAGVSVKSVVKETVISTNQIQISYSQPYEYGGQIRWQEQIVSCGIGEFEKRLDVALSKKKGLQAIAAITSRPQAGIVSPSTTLAA